MRFALKGAGLARLIAVRMRFDNGRFWEGKLLLAMMKSHSDICRMILAKKHEELLLPTKKCGYGALAHCRTEKKKKGHHLQKKLSTTVERLVL